MELSEELPIYKDMYRMILLIFEYTKEFSREYKYTLGQDMKRHIISLVRSVYRANLHKITVNTQDIASKEVKTFKIIKN